MRTLFIGDLHLSADRPDITKSFIRFLESIPNDTQALYILGDLFEVWVGDDLAEKFTIPIAQALFDLSQHCPIYYIHGNRDFMLGEAFAKSCNMQILPEIFVTSLYGKNTVILHGDSLCTLDKAYQRFRKFRSIRIFRYLYSKLPKYKRLNIAKKLRKKSHLSNKVKQDYIMDVEKNAVLQLLNKTNCVQMIHGHTHKPAINQLQNNLSRMVVGDWYEQGSVLTVTPTTAELISL